jgi:hypothetical protein
MRVQTLTLAVAILSLGSIGLSQQSTPTATTTVSRVHQLVMEDQSENPGNTSEEEFNRHGDARRAETRKLLAEGKIVSSEDFSDASLIFQHGQTPNDFLFAHILAVEALTRGGSADKWMTTATLDRYLQSVNQPQVFGTQYSGVRSTGNAPKTSGRSTCAEYSADTATIRSGATFGLSTRGLLCYERCIARKESSHLQHRSST